MNASRSILFVALIATLLANFAAAPARADPWAGQELKFQQLPMDDVVIAGEAFFGHDELSYAWRQPDGHYVGSAMADDFADELDLPVAHVRWWGSYPDGGPPVQRFLVAFEADVPLGANPDVNFSHPGPVLHAEVVHRQAAVGAMNNSSVPQRGEFTEQRVSIGGAPLNEHLYVYNAQLRVPFEQKPDTVYWLKIAGISDPNDPGEGQVFWGWHNRDYTVQNGLASSAVVPGERDMQPIIDPGYPSEVWHFQDNAVFSNVDLALDPLGQPLLIDQGNFAPQYYLDGIDGPGVNFGGHGGIAQFSKDLAFELYAVPEPSSMVLLALGGLLMLKRRKST
jgi:hypothetical protein